MRQLIRRGVVLAILLCAPTVMGGDTPGHEEVHRVPLPTGGLPEHWTVSVPQYDGQLTTVTVDLALDVTGRAGYEQIGAGWTFKPWSWLFCREHPSVVLNGARVHEELVALYGTSIGVSYNFDGELDFGGQSGTTFARQTTSIGGPTQMSSTDAWEGTGSVRLHVNFFATDTGQGSAVPTWGGLLRVQAGGELVVTYSP